MKRIPKPRNRRIVPWHLVLVGVICAVVYGNSLFGAFVWDDEVQIVRNPTIRSLANIPSAFTQPFWAFAAGGESNHTNFYRPVQTVLYSIAYWWGALTPTSYHALSIVLHAVACLFLYLICIELGFSPGLSLLAAALFAVHPIHTEAVAWIAGIADVACGAFFLGAFWAFLKSGDERKSIWIVLSSGLYLVSLLSKEMAITLPLILIVWMLRRGQFRKLIALWPFGVATLIYLILRVHALGLLATQHLDIQASWLDWTTLAVRVFGQYIWYSLIPYPLIAYHLIATHFSDRTASTVGAMAAIMLLVVLVWKTHRKIEGTWFWSVSFALLLIPVFYFKGISLTFMAERYLYIPSFAVILLIVTVISKIDARKGALAGWILVVVFAVLTIVRNQDWSSSERLYVQTLAAEPGIAHFEINLADILMKRGDDAGSRQHLVNALESFASDKYVQIAFDHYRAEVGVGALDARAKNYADAKRHFEKALEIYPNGDWAYLYLGGIMMEADLDYPKAIEYFNKAIQLGPLNEVARDYLGIAFLNQGHYEEAARYFQEALQINPTYEDARNHLDLATRAMKP